MLPCGRPRIGNIWILFLVDVALRAASIWQNQNFLYFLDHLVGFEHQEYARTLSFGDCCRMHQSTCQTDIWERKYITFFRWSIRLERLPAPPPPLPVKIWPVDLPKLLFILMRALSLSERLEKLFIDKLSWVTFCGIWQLEVGFLSLCSLPHAAGFGEARHAQQRCAAGWRYNRMSYSRDGFPTTS